MDPFIASVLLDIGIDRPLDYLVTETDWAEIRPGMRVRVPVRGDSRTGTILEKKRSSACASLLPIESLMQESAFPPDLLALGEWMSRYYVTPLRKVLKHFLPSQVRDENYHPYQQAFIQLRAIDEAKQHYPALRPPQAAVVDCLLRHPKGLLLTELLEKAGVSRSPVETLRKKEWLSWKDVVIDRSPLIGEEYCKTLPKQLNPEQQAAVHAFVHALESKEFVPFLLHGVTGSGKTEVYLQTMETALAQGRSALLLVPEISLTEQTIRRLKGRFHAEVAILHHRLSSGERHDQWHRIRRGEARIVVGARSALFSPIQNLGLIIVDEEHDGAYKQAEERPTYHARDMAVLRGKLTQSVVILGSATPSMESMYNVRQGKYRLYSLGSRATASSLPQVSIVDMRREMEQQGRFSLFSKACLDQLEQRLQQGEQAILFLNRRGYFSRTQCPSCGWVAKCPHCDFSLTFHLQQERLCCHLCGYLMNPVPKQCPSCNHIGDLKYGGVGTEQVERHIHRIFPQARTLRLDSDTTKHKGSHDRILKQFRTGKADILIGTQMLAKGLHFPAVTLVVVIYADATLHIPDFRANEQTFQLITQVAGRAGRGEVPGEVIIQTQMPDCTIIQQAAKQDYLVFFEEELRSRQMFAFPPFSHLIKCMFMGSDLRRTEQDATQFRERLLTLLSQDTYVFPVSPAGYPKIKDTYRFQFLIRGPSTQRMTTALQQVPLPTHTKLHIDVDALSTL